MNFKYIFILAIVLVSCSDLKKPEQLEKVDDLLESVSSSTTALEENEIQNLEEILVLSSDMTSVFKQYESDTIDVDIALKFDRFQSMNEKIVPVMQWYDTLDSLLEQQESKLKELRNDIDQGSGKRNKYDTYIQFEKEKVTKLESRVEECITAMKEIEATYEELHNEINELLTDKRVQ
jgi:chromosome segregation ATPase